MADSQKRINQFFLSALEDNGESDSVDQEQDLSDNHTNAADADDEADAETDLCECQCCSNVSTPHQPLELSQSKTTQSYLSESKAKSHSRMIQNRWYELHPWISVCTSKYRIYCSTCLSAKEQGLLNPKCKQTTFVDSGFSNWKKALSSFRTHESSSMHKDSILKLMAKNKGVGIDAQLRAQHNSDQKHHQLMFMKLLQAIQFLARQGLPFRGHKEDIEAFSGNLYQLLLLQAKDSPQMISWLEKRQYISPDIVNEVITLMGQCVLRNILTEVCSSLWYSIIVDEATDIAHNEQMSVSVRWVDGCYCVNERTLGLIQLPNTMAETIFQAEKDILIRCSLPIGQCRGQAYDGAANMSGIRNGVQALFKKEVPQVLYVHCLAHSLNLSLKDVTNNCELIRDVMSFIYDLAQLFKFSPKRLALFNSLRKEVSINTGEVTPNLRMLCPTRWTVRHTSIASILRNYSIIQTALEEIRHGYDEYAAKASGMSLKMEDFDMFFGLKLAYLVFSSAEQLSTNLQAKDISVQEAVHGGELLTAHLRSLRSAAKFDAFYDAVVSDNGSLTTKPTLPRQRKRPKRFNDGSSPHTYKTPRDRHRHMYLEVCELAAGEVERRFTQKDMRIIKNIETCLIESANKNHHLSEELETYLKLDFDIERLKIQLSMLPDVIKTSSLNVNKVTNIRTIVQAMNDSHIYKGMLLEIDKLLKLYLTFPVTTSTAERSFSTLRRLKTFLRNTMTSCRLNNLFLMYVHQDLTDSLDLHQIARDFVAMNNRRKQYFGNF